MISGEPVGCTAVTDQLPAPRAIGLNGIGVSAPVVESIEYALTVSDPSLMA